jgi:hypothetical protein
MPSTGDICQTSGIYNGVCTKNGTHQVKQVAISRGNKFPPCHTSQCQGSVRYTLVQETKEPK